MIQAKLHAAVVRAHQGEVCLEKAVERVLFDGRPAPLLWGDWGEERIRLWDSAVMLYRSMESLEVNLSVSGVWVVVSNLVVPNLWPKTPYVSVGMISRALSVRPTVAGYQMKKQGWRWQGRYSMRRVQMVPCARCAAVMHAEAVDPRHGLCPECSE